VLTQLDSLEVDGFTTRATKGAVWQAIRNLEATSKPIDVVTLEVEIEKQGKLDAIGGIAFLGELALRVPTADNVVAYAEIVGDKHQARKLMLASSEIHEMGYEDGLEVRDYLDSSEAKIFEVTQRKDRTGPEPVKALVKKVFGSLEERFAAGGIPACPLASTSSISSPPACSRPSSSSSRHAPRWARRRSRYHSRRTPRPPAAGRASCSRSRCRQHSWPSACCVARRASTRRRSAAASCSART
jgi:hypothetical protein